MMQMAKASEDDLEAAMELCGAFDALTRRFDAMVPDQIARPEGTSDTEYFDREDSEQCVRVLGYLLDVADRASLMRVVFGMCVLLDPRNKIVDPDADTLKHHPETVAALAAKSALRQSSCDYNVLAQENGALRATQGFTAEQCLSCGGTGEHLEGCAGTTALHALSAELEAAKKERDEYLSILKSASYVLDEAGYSLRPRIDAAIAQPPTEHDKPTEAQQLGGDLWGGGRF